MDDAVDDRHRTPEREDDEMSLVPQPYAAPGEETVMVALQYAGVAQLTVMGSWLTNTMHGIPLRAE